MPGYDNDRTTYYEIGKAYDFDGTTNYPLGKGYDFDGTTNSPIYNAEIILVGEGAEESEITDAANWSGEDEVTLTRITLSGGEGQSADTAVCQVPLPTGYSTLEVNVSRYSDESGYDAYMRIGTSKGASDFKSEILGDHTYTIDPDTEYYISLYVKHTYTRTANVYLTYLKLS